MNKERNEINKMMEDEERRLLERLKMAEVNGAEYEDLLKNVEKVAEIRRRDAQVGVDKRRDNIGLAAKVGSGVLALGTFLLMLKQEQTGSFRSKGYDWFKDFLRESKR